MLLLFEDNSISADDGVALLDIRHHLVGIDLILIHAKLLLVCLTFQIFLFVNALVAFLQLRFDNRLRVLVEVGVALVFFLVGRVK